jgi:hypothetical protein
LPSCPRAAFRLTVSRHRVNITLNEMGRRPIGEKAANFFGLRLPDEIATRVDAYAKCMGIKTRSEAARSLLMLGLATHHEAEVKQAASKRAKKTKRD